MMVQWLVLSLLLVLGGVHSVEVTKERHHYQDTGTMSVLSPRFPAAYAGDLDIRWMYNITYATGLRVDVHTLDLAPVRQHCYDKLQLWQYKHNKNGKLIGTKTALCGSHVSELAKKSYTFDHEPGYGAYLEIHFESDHYSKNGVFNLSVTPLCDTELNASSSPRVVTSPLYPNHYPSHIACRHVIRATEGKKLQLDVVDVDMEGEGSCSGRDHVTMTSLMPDGSETVADVICDSDHTTRYISDTGAAIIQFVSNAGDKNSRGFKISYMEVDKTTTTEEPITTTLLATTTTEETTTTTTTTEVTTTEQQTTTVNETDVVIAPIGVGGRVHGGEALENSNSSSSSSTTLIVVILLCIVIVVCIAAFLVVRRRQRNKLNNNMLFDIPVTFSALNSNGDLPPVPTANQEEIRRENPYVEIPVEGCGGGDSSNIYHTVGGSTTEEDDISRIKQNFSKVYVEVPPLPEKNAPTTERLNNKCVQDDDDDASFVKCHPVAKPRSANNSQVTQMKNDLMKGYQRYTAPLQPTCDDGEDSDDVFTPSTSARSSYKQENNSNAANTSASQPSSVYAQPRALLASESCDRQQDAIKSSTMVPISPEAIDGSSGAGPSTSFPLPNTDPSSTYDQVRKKPLKRESDYCMMKRSHDNLLTIDDEGTADNESVYVKMNSKSTTSSESSSSSTTV